MSLNLRQLLSNNKNIVSNFSYMAILEILVLISPLLTYPYLVRVLGSELYGWVITAQITASYANILIDFGFNRVSAKHVAANRDNLGELSKVFSSVTFLRFMLWIVSFILYMGIVMLIPAYREQLILFLFSYGLTLSSVLFPNFYFQGIEQMKHITVINVLTRLVFVLATFLIITRPEQYIYVPLLWSTGYFLGGMYSMYIIMLRHKIRFVTPSIADYKFHLRETTPIFLSDVMLNVKDKFSYNLMGGMLGMSDVVIYDVGTKIVNLLTKPTSIFSVVMFPSMSRNPDVKKTKRIMGVLFLMSILMVAVVYCFLPQIVKLFINEYIDLFPLRIYLMVPLFTGLSYYIPSSVFVAFGRNRYVLYSTIFSSCSYAVLLLIMWFGGFLTSVMNFIILTVASYFMETLFRLFLSYNIFKTHTGNNQ